MVPEYSLEIQAHIPAAFATIHNFIHIHDSDVGPIQDADEEDYDPGHPNDANYRASSLEAEQQDDTSDVRRDEIAQVMWDDYLTYQNVDSGEESDNDIDSISNSNSTTHTT